MSNVPNSARGPARDSVIDDFGAFFGRWGMSRTTGRVWGYLLLTSEPVSLDRIAADLLISKSTASVAARQLEQILFARRTGVPGGRRALYQATETNEHFLEMITDAYRPFLGLFQAAAAVAERGPARQRLEGMSIFYSLWLERLQEVRQLWRERRQ